MQSILLLEDDAILSKEISVFLAQNHFDCALVYDGSLIEKQLKIAHYDLAILDINVPGLNGLEVCKMIRNQDKNISILMLTAFGEVNDKVIAFNSGADDYLVKPFHFDELLVRIKALLRRKESPQKQNVSLEIGPLRIDPVHMIVTKNELEINLSPKEFKLLNILAQAQGRVLSKNQIAEKLWDYHIETNHNTIEVYINFLRKKIETDQFKIIHTKIGYGYYLKVQEDELKK